MPSQKGIAMGKNKKSLAKELDEEIFRETKVHGAFHKYIGRLSLEQLFTSDSVYLAAGKAASGFWDRNDTDAFMASASRNAVRLCDDVLSGKFRPRYYKEQEITERGKKRVIKPPTFECKVVQKTLSNGLIRGMFEPRMVSTNYASIRGRGTQKLYKDVLAALNKALRQGGKAVVMTDFRNYFGSIDTEKLRLVYEKYVLDANLIDLIMSFSPEPMGLSLGNEVSQVPASFFPSVIDHTMRDKYGLPFFRYMDDGLLICDMEEAKEMAELLKQMAKDRGLLIPEEKVKIVPVGENFVYCKERFLIDKRRGGYYGVLNPDIARSERRKLRTFGRKVRDGKMRDKDMENQYKGVRGMVKSHPNTWRTLKRMDEVYEKARDKIHAKLLC